MADRLPLVLGADGLPQQLQPSDTLDGVPEVTNDAFTVDGGTPSTTFGGTLQVDFGGVT